MQHILSRIAALIPDFGRRSLSLSELRDQCQLRTIALYEIPMRRVHGCTWSDEHGTCIFINSNLYHQAKLLAAWHEFAHAILHPTDQRVLASLGKFTNRDRWELEANAVAAIAVCPQIPPNEAASSRLELFRVELFERYGV